MARSLATAHTTGRRRRGVVTAVLVALVTLLVAPGARADTLSDLRERAAQAGNNAAAAAGRVAQSQDQVSRAQAELAHSQNRLTQARNVLADLQVQLQAARERDAALAEELAAARAALAAAREKVAQGEADVAAQQKVIIGAVTESYQQRTDLAGLSVVFGSESTAELGQRLQWNTTIFDTQAAHKARLDAILLELEQARDEAAAAEERVAAAKAESEANVAEIARLEGEAAAQEQAVAALVRANEEARAAAEGALAADEAQFRAYRAQEDQLEQEIRGELARLKAEAEAREREARERAEREAARAAAARAAAEQAAAERAAAERRAAERATAPAPVARPAEPAPSRSSGPRVSAYGLIRPINASPGSPFGMRYHPILNYWREHNGNDWGAPTGTPLYAVADGVVLKAGANGGFGNFVLIGHDRGIGGRYVTSGYAHQSRIVVRAGQRVSQGQVIGYVGNTGLSTTPHLHFEIRLDGTPVNPMAYLP